MDILPAVDSGCERVVARALDRVGDLATLPEITLKIIETVEDPRSTARNLHEIVIHDLALSARILRVVNSAFYGLPGQVASIERAIVMLGLNAVKNIAIAASLSRMFRGGRISRKYSARDLWIHSVAIGTASKMIVETLRMPLPDEAFVGGLIHDIGLVVMLQSDLPAMQQLMRVLDYTQEDDEPSLSGRELAERFVEAEQRLFGAGHQVFGAGLARRWKFPRSFQYVVGYHHRPAMLARDNRLLTQVVAAAEMLCGELEIGLTVPIDAMPADPALLQELGLGPYHLDRLRGALPSQAELAQGLFD